MCENPRVTHGMSKITRKSKGHVRAQKSYGSSRVMREIKNDMDTHMSPHLL